MSTNIGNRDWRTAFKWGDLTTAETEICAGILGNTTRQPDLIIAPDGNPYMYRWHVIPRNERANVYLHVQVSDDAGRHLHDHPWDNQSVILSGGYLEFTPYTIEGNFPVVRRTGDVIHRQAAARHRLELIPGIKRSISLFSTGPTIREWGFYTRDGWVLAKDMTDNEGNYSTKKEAA